MKEKEGRKEKEREKKKEEQLGECQVCVCGKCEKTRALRVTNMEERNIQMVSLTMAVSYLDSPGKSSISKLKKAWMLAQVRQAPGKPESVGL